RLRAWYILRRQAATSDKDTASNIAACGHEQLGIEVELGPFGGLHLLDRDDRSARSVVPCLREPEYRVSRAVDPLPEELAEVAPPCLLERALQINAQCIAVTVRAVVRTDTVEERVVTEYAAQHVQHERALLVRVRVEQREQVGQECCGRVDERKAGVAGAQVLRARLLELCTVYLGTVRFLEEQAREVRGEAFRQPQVLPVPLGCAVAEPLVRNLV